MIPREIIFEWRYYLVHENSEFVQKPIATETQTDKEWIILHQDMYYPYTPSVKSWGWVALCLLERCTILSFASSLLYSRFMNTYVHAYSR